MRMAARWKETGDVARGLLPPALAGVAMLALAALLAGCATGFPSIPGHHERLVKVSGQSGGERLHVDVTGRGRPVVLLHGLGGNATSWSAVAPLLASRHRVYIPEQLGFGRSDKPLGADYSLEAQARRVVRLIRSLGLERPVLVGDSTGGTIALHVARLAPDDIGPLVLIAAPLAVEELDLVRLYARIPEITEAAIEGAPARLTAAVSARSIYPFGYIPRLESIEAQAHVLDQPGAREASVATLRALAVTESAGLRRAVSRMRREVAILTCEDDDVVPISHAEELNARIRGSKLVILGRCNHAGHYIHADRIAEVIAEIAR
ncbi:MAG: alpha/beta fold hydrolase [Rhizobiales bacterium]|nr:alpha/beta fold hydrolase [Hyphomicrobiales bacterium]